MALRRIFADYTLDSQDTPETFGTGRGPSSLSQLGWIKYAAAIQSQVTTKGLIGPAHPIHLHNPFGRGGCGPRFLGMYSPFATYVAGDVVHSYTETSPISGTAASGSPTLTGLSSGITGHTTLGLYAGTKIRVYSGNTYFDATVVSTNESAHTVTLNTNATFSGSCTIRFPGYVASTQNSNKGNDPYNSAAWTPQFDATGYAGKTYSPSATYASGEVARLPVRTAFVALRGSTNKNPFTNLQDWDRRYSDYDMVFDAYLDRKSDGSVFVDNFVQAWLPWTSKGNRIRCYIGNLDWNSRYQSLTGYDPLGSGALNWASGNTYYASPTLWGGIPASLTYVNGRPFMCTRSHIADSTNRPDTGASWRQYWMAGKRPDRALYMQRMYNMLLPFASLGCDVMIDGAGTAPLNSMTHGFLTMIQSMGMRGGVEGPPNLGFTHLLSFDAFVTNDSFPSFNAGSQTWEPKENIQGDITLQLQTGVNGAGSEATINSWLKSWITTKFDQGFSVMIAPYLLPQPISAYYPDGYDGNTGEYAP